MGILARITSGASEGEESTPGSLAAAELGQLSTPRICCSIGGGADGCANTKTGFILYLQIEYSHIVTIGLTMLQLQSPSMVANNP